MTAVSAPDRTQPTTSAPPSAKRRFSVTPYLLLIPAIVVLLFALGYPMLWQLWTSTQKFGLAQQFGRPPEFVGLANYGDLLADPAVHRALGRTLYFSVFTVLGGVALAVLIARSLTRPIVQLTKAVQGAARNGKVAIPVEARGETGVLARAFARVAAEHPAATETAGGNARRS